MASVIVKVTGLRELGESLRGMASDMSNKIARQGTGAGAQVIRKRWREIVPVAAEPHSERGTVKQPGNYRDNIVAKKVPASQSNFTSEHLVVVRGGRKHNFASHTAALLEFGTVKMAAGGYGRKAYDGEGQHAVEALKEKIRAGVDKAKR